MGNTNILLVANYPSDVGYAWWLMENFWCEISTLAVSEGKNCILIYPEINAIPNNIKGAEIDILEQSIDYKSLSDIIKVLRMIVNRKVGTVYLTDRKTRSFLYLFFRVFGVRKIILHDHAPGERAVPGIIKGHIKALLSGIKMINCDLYIGVSEFVKNRLINIDKIPATKCVCVHNGIEPININSKNIREWKAELNIPETAIIVASTGRATYYKGIDFMIKCANALKEIENLFFLHIGDGPDMDDFKMMRDDYGLQRKFIFAGRREDVSILLPQCHIGFQASKGEAFSLSILEYLSAGLPTIAPDVCGNGEAIKSGVNGYLYDVNDLDGAVKYLRQLCMDYELREVMKKQAIHTVDQNFTIKIMNRQFCKTVEGFIN